MATKCFFVAEGGCVSVSACHATNQPILFCCLCLCQKNSLHDLKRIFWLRKSRTASWRMLAGLRQISKFIGPDWRTSGLLMRNEGFSSVTTVYGSTPCVSQTLEP